MAKTPPDQSPVHGTGLWTHDNPQWPIFSSNYQGPVARVLGDELHNSLLGAATVIHDGVRIRNSIIRREAVVEEDVELEDCIIMDYTRIGRGAHLRRVIVDRHNQIEPGDRASVSTRRRTGAGST